MTQRATPSPSGPDDARGDAALLEALRAGDAEAVGVLYERHALFAYRVARRFASSDEDAADTVHDAFAWVIRARPRLHPGAAFTSLLYPALKHAALARRRQDRRLRLGLDVAESTHPAAPSVQSDPAPDNLVAGGAGPDEELARAIAALPDAQGEVLLLSVVDGLKHEQIAHALGVPVGTVKSRLHHAVAALRRAMESP